jgi:hypothetical protein
MTIEQKEFYILIKDLYASCEIENAALLAFNEAKSMYNN